MTETTAADGAGLAGAWEGAFGWEAYLEEEVVAHRALWHAVWERARVPEPLAARAAALGGAWRLLAISEDWCGDAVNTLPPIARLAGAVPGAELRVVKRDEHPALMDRFLTGGKRSIPLVVVMRGDLSVAGRWGPRPAELQAWVLAEKARGERPAPEIYRDVRRWYARDRGETTLAELLGVMEGAAVSGC